MDSSSLFPVTIGGKKQTLLDQQNSVSRFLPGEIQGYPAEDVEKTGGPENKQKTPEK